MHVGQKKQAVATDCNSNQKKFRRGFKNSKASASKSLRKKLGIFLFCQCTSCAKKKQRAGARRNFLASCPALFNFTYIYDDYPVKISRRFSLRLTPNCFMLPGRKEKRLLHFSFHAAGEAKGSSFSFTPRSRCCRSRDACRPSPLYVYIISVWGSLQLPSSRLAFGRKNDQTPD